MSATDGRNSGGYETGLRRLLVLTQQYPNPLFPGWASFNRQQLDALADLARLRVVAPVPWTELARARRPRLVSRRLPYPVDWPPFWYLPGRRRDWQARGMLWSTWPSLRRAAAALKPQALLATWLFPDGWAGMRAARRLGLPWAVKLHGSDLMVFRRDPQRLPYLREVLAAAPAVIAVSESLARAAGELGARWGRVFVVPNGLDAGLFRPAGREAARRELNLPAEGRLVLFVGRLAEVKGPDLALQAVARAPWARLVVVGDGPMAPALRRQAAELGLADRVVWAGARPHREVPRYLAAADAVILSSRSEGSPNAVLEALGCGRPVAAFAVGGVPELVRPGREGELAAPGDPDDLARALGAVLAQDWRPEELAERVAGRGWADSAARLLAVMEGVISERYGA